MKTLKRYKSILLSFWFTLLLSGLILFLMLPEKFSAGAIASFMQRFGSYVLAIYCLVSILRGLTLIPSTPFVFAGLLLFQNQPFLVLIISMIGIAFSTTLIYFFSHLLNLDKAIQKIYPQEKLQKKLNSHFGIFFVFLWSFFPIVPTDAVSFAAGVVRMNFVKFIVAVLLGELIICSGYIYLGKTIVEMI